MQNWPGLPGKILTDILVVETPSEWFDGKFK